MKKLPFFIRRNLAAKQLRDDEHPDPDALVAFGERNLAAAERDRILNHLAECPECREVLALAAAVNTDAAATAGPVREPKSVLWGWPILAAAAVVCSATLMIWHPSFFNRRPLPNRPELLNISRPAALDSSVSVAKVTPPAPAVPRPRTRVRKKDNLHLQAVPEVENRAGAPPENAANEFRNPNAQMDSFAMQRKLYAEESQALNQSAGVARSQMFPAEPRATSVPATEWTPHTEQSTVWSLGTSAGDGALRKSDDGGKTWHIVQVDNATQLFALSVNGSDVWVGGAGGELFHSVDDGNSWRLIAVADAPTSLTDSITKIDVRGATITLRTNSGAKWISDDAGAHWRRE